MTTANVYPTNTSQTNASHFQAIIESTDDAIISKSLEGIVISWNNGAHTLFGYSAMEMIGQSMLRLFPADKKDEEKFILEKILAGGKIDHFETTRLRKDGSTIEVSVTISPIRDEAGNIIGASKVARDISMKKMLERHLHLTASVFTNTNEAILITDAAGTIIEVNDAFSRITGCCREDVLGHNPAMLINDDQRAELIPPMLNALIQDGHYQCETWNRRKDGKAYAGLLKVSVVQDQSGVVQNYVAIFTDITTLRLKQKELEHLAHFDPLTNLPNRNLLSDRLHQSIAASQRRHQPLAVLYLDLDGFKTINDTYGHSVGDQLLIVVSRRMKAVLRDVDTLARIGCDEYVALLVDLVNRHDCTQLVERILHACAEPIILHGTSLQISTSIGITMYPQDDADPDQLIRHADRAMYEAKQTGKNRYYWFDSSLETEIKNRGLQHERINQALIDYEFVLKYQPKVNMRTGVVLGVEALIRWNHPERGELSPDAFLPAIENHPLSEAVGQWVIESALAQLERWKKAGLGMSVSVNISARQLQQENFTSSLTLLLAKYPDVNPKDLELEILETSVFQNIHLVSAVIRDCKSLGVRFAIDDFGTGYSSLTYLKYLPAETIKIDRSFIRDLLEDQENLMIVHGVIGLAAAFGRKVIAEGVETIGIGEKLIDLGCELAQGYAISRPMPGDQLAQWVSTWSSPPSWSAVFC